VTKDISQLGRLIAASHGWPAAKAFKAYRMTSADQSALTSCAVDLLKVFPADPGTGAMLTAAFAVQLERVLAAPLHVMRGRLMVAGQAVAGTEEAADHSWVMVGPYVADIAIFRMAYSRTAPALLFHHLDSVFGGNKALYVDHWTRTRRLGIEYDPQHVLDEAEVTDLMGQAYRLLQDQGAGSA